MKRGGPIKRRAIPRKMPKFRHRQIECPEYLAWIRRLPCILRRLGCVCEVTYPVESHHVGHFGRARENDFNAIPLCALGHHREGPFAVHRLGRKAFESRFGIDLDAEVRRLNEQWIAEAQQNADLMRKLTAHLLCNEAFAEVTEDRGKAWEQDDRS